MKRNQAYNPCLLWLLFLCLALGCGCQRKESFSGFSPAAEVQLGKTEAPEGLTKTESLESDAPKPLLYVHVCGAVSQPGVYEVPDGARLYQAVELAGGFLPEAAAECVNLAGALTDGQQIYIPTKDEASQGMPAAVGSTEAASSMVNLNTATKEELMTLPGIGSAKADSILSYRKENGAFSSVEEIMQIPGIKESIFDKIKNNICV